MQYITFYDEETDEKILFEIIDQLTVDGKKYILVADDNDQSAILEELRDEGDEITYGIIEDDAIFQKLTLLFMESDEYDIEI
jgi:hypothetical protein